MVFDKAEIELLKNILQNADDKLLYELFGDMFLNVKEKLKQMKKEKESQLPYQFRQHFSDIS